MKTIWKAFASTAIAFTLAFSAAAFAGCNAENEEPYEGCEEDNVVAIDIEDNYAADKVVTTGFTVEAGTKSASAFKLPKLIGDNMLLQANVVNKIWGNTGETGSVAVQVINAQGATESTCYGTITDGAFTVYLKKHDYGTGYKIRIVSEGGKYTEVNNVAFGELWIGGGQSNMGWEMGQCYKKSVNSLRYQTEIDQSANENIRLFRVHLKSEKDPEKNKPLDDVVSAVPWQEARPATVKSFSAAAYFFAKELNAQYNVPVGVIMSCQGGTGIHTWLPESVMGDAEGHYNPDDELFTDSSCYNGMIAPLRNMTVRGVLWYQGEGDHNRYDHNYGLLMKGWREAFGRDNIWFTTVTLPRFPNAESYFLCREQQKAASVKDQYATYSVNIDCGLLPRQVAEGDNINPDGIHPYDKKPVGERAAHVTMRDLYGAKGVWGSPVFKSAKTDGSEVVITFSNVGKGLVLQGRFGFEIAGADGIFYKASVKVTAENKIKVWSDKVSKPTQVVYGRANDDLEEIDSYADCVCLYNTKGDDKEIAYPAEQFIWEKQ